MAERLAAKRNRAASLLALVSFEKMSKADAWARLEPGDAGLSDDARRKRAERLLQWYMTYYPPNFQEALELQPPGARPHPAGAAGDAEGDAVRRRFQAVDPGLAHSQRGGEAHDAAERDHPQGDYLDGAIKDARTKDREIDTGPEFKRPRGVVRDGDEGPG